MATIKYWNGSAWELAIVGKQGPAGPTGPTGPDSVTTKGDIATYSTTPTRLPVGANGETLVADSSTSTGLRWQGNFAAGKNAFINGDFRINQRSFTSTTTDGTYGFDRWFMNGSAGSCTYSAQTFTPGTAPVAGYEGVNFARLATTGQNATSGYSILMQHIEDVRTFAGQTITVSFWAKAASGTPKIALETSQNFGSGGSASVDTYANQVTISTSWTRYSITLSVPSVSGKTIGSSSSLRINFWTSAGTTYNSRTGSIGVQNNTIDFWGMQAEAGSVATTFQTATGTLQGELAACQRYYYREGGDQIYQTFATGYGESGTSIVYAKKHPVTMRVAPTSFEYGTVANYQTGVAAITSNLTQNNAGRDLSSLKWTGVTGASIGQVYNLIANNSTSAYVGFSAEL